ncbi:MAG TPA: cation diffusion facilitator family transporter [Candidatus Dormibacteraeota bacterium]|nr:cation diffusion facilitator family transporter [Candidatus Dormibacteraeota bacterium]
MKTLERRPELVALVSVGIGVFLVAAKLIVGLLTGSLGILSEAGHSLFDLAASIFTLFAVRTARKPADREHPYGHGRAENLAAFAEGMLLLIIAAAVGFEAIRRLVVGGPNVNPTGYAFVLLIGTVVIESGRAIVMRRVGHAISSEAMLADSTDRLADVLANVGVLVGLVGVRAGLVWADAVAALVVALIIVRAAGLLTWRSGDILIDRAPAGAEDTLRNAIKQVAGVREVRSVRVRRSGPNLIGDVSIATGRMLPVEAAGALVEAVKERARAVLPRLDLAVSVEGQKQRADLVERIHAAAARNGGVRDLHNVTVEREADGSLHLTMHAKLPGDQTMARATRTSRALERAIRAELPEVTRIDIHLEPMEPQVVPGQDVTARNAKLAASIRRLVESHPDVRRSVDVELSDRIGQIHAHVVAEVAGDISLEHAHRIESELEEMIRRKIPEAHEVVTRVTA